MDDIYLPLTNLEYSFALQAFIIKKTVQGEEYHEKRGDIRNKLKHTAICYKHFETVSKAVITELIANTDHLTQE